MLKLLNERGRTKGICLVIISKLNDSLTIKFSCNSRRTSHEVYPPFLRNKSGSYVRDLIWGWNENMWLPFRSGFFELRICATIHPTALFPFILQPWLPIQDYFPR